MIRENLEFSISQFVDGTLVGGELAELEQVLKTDAEVRELVEEYRRLNVILKTSMPLPDVRWEVLSQSISAAVDDAADAEETRVADVYRIGSWARSFGGMLAIAASLLVASGVGIAVYVSHRPTAVTPADSQLANATPQQSLPLPASIEPPKQTEFASAIVVCPPDSRTSQPIEIHVNVGPSDQVKDEPIVVRYSDDLISRPSRVAVASGVAPMHETDGFIPDMQ